MLPSDVVDLGVDVVGGETPLWTYWNPGNGMSSSRGIEDPDEDEVGGMRPKLTPARIIGDVMELADCDMIAGSLHTDDWEINLKLLAAEYHRGSYIHFTKIAIHRIRIG